MPSPGEMMVMAVGGAAVLIPVMAVSARLAVRPIVDAIVRLRESGNTTAEARSADARFARIEAQLMELTSHMETLAAAEAFHAELRAGSMKAVSPPSEPPA